MHRDLQGYYMPVSMTGEQVKAFVPAPLPPKPPIDWQPELTEKFHQALLALGRLDSMAVLLPDASLFLYMYVRKEAVLSSMIEGTQSSLADLLLFETDSQPGVPLNDVREVSNYVAALDYGMTQLTDGVPLSVRLLKQIHAILLSDGRGKHQSPGEFRSSQNWIGGSRPGVAAFVPPPSAYVQDCMGELELFLHNRPQKTVSLVKAALAHVQFETIHPFLDGNGRVGRLLITLLLCSEKILAQPVLYLSLYFKTHRQRYYELLNEVRLTGDWEIWLAFFADAVADTATQAVESAQQLLQLANEDSQRIRKIKRISGSLHLVHRAMLERPIAATGWVQQITGLAPATVNACLRELEQLGIVKELTGQRRNRIYSYGQYIQIMSKGTDLPR
ncbi:MAG: Fic family protein [Gammaproteobacteria bacterium]